MDEKERDAGGALTTNLPDLACYMQSVIGQLEADKKRLAVYTYTYVLKSATELYGGEGTLMPVGEIFTPSRLKKYEEQMKLEGARKRSSDKGGAQKIDRGPKGLNLNTISTYMHDLKAAYNRFGICLSCLSSKCDMPTRRISPAPRFFNSFSISWFKYFMFLFL